MQAPDIFCPMIHGGLNVNLKTNDNLAYNQCCLSTTPLTFVDKNHINWTGDPFAKNREKNNLNQWLPGCWQCETLEKTGAKSFRKSMIHKFGVNKDLKGPQRIDLLFDRSCNLACRTCGPQSSTLWEKHLRDNNLPIGSATAPNNNAERVKKILEALDLENLGMVQFCGGETLLGNNYWNVAQWLADHVPNAKQNLEIGFQTNGTQPIDPRWFETIEKFKLVKLMVSIDGTGDRFEYLRWPANWNQTVDNIMSLRSLLPSNVMFFVQECTSCLNLFYFTEVKDWIAKNFATNREGDPVEHATQLAMHNYLYPTNITEEYAQAIAHTKMSNIIPNGWRENPDKIKQFLFEVEKFDKIRNQDWKKVFPEVAKYYQRYI